MCYISLGGIMSGRVIVYLVSVAPMHLCVYSLHSVSKEDPVACW